MYMVSIHTLYVCWFSYVILYTLFVHFSELTSKARSIYVLWIQCKMFICSSSLTLRMYNHSTSLYAQIPNSWAITWWLKVPQVVIPHLDIFNPTSQSATNQIAATVEMFACLHFLSTVDRPTSSFYILFANMLSTNIQGMKKATMQQYIQVVSQCSSLIFPRMGKLIIIPQLNLYIYT